MDFSNFAYADNEQDKQKVNTIINHSYVDLYDDELVINEIKSLKSSTKPSLHTLFIKSSKSKAIPKVMIMVLLVNFIYYSNSRLNRLLSKELAPKNYINLPDK